jgi:hypothetical protein
LTTACSVVADCSPVQGEAQLKKGGGLFGSIFGGGSTKFENGAELFSKAGNMFKVAKMCKAPPPPSSSCRQLTPNTGQEAGDAYVKTADCHVRNAPLAARSLVVTGPLCSKN